MEGEVGKKSSKFSISDILHKDDGKKGEVKRKDPTTPETADADLVNYRA